MKEPWCKFYPRDWRGDAQLQQLPLQARGLWVEMLCIMAQSERKGFLLVNGAAPSVRQLAAFVRADMRTTMRTLLLLENAHIFARDENGVIYSRRMVRDAHITEVRTAAIKKRWEARPARNDANLYIQNGIQNSDFVCTQIPDTREEEEEAPLTPQGGAASHFACPGIEEIRAYAGESGASVETAERFHRMNEAGDWRDNTGKQIRNWRKAFIAFAKRDADKAGSRDAGGQGSAPATRRSKREPKKTFFRQDHSKGF